MRVAVTAQPCGSPVSASSPEGMSRARTGTPRRFTCRIAATNGSSSGRSTPVPSIASTTSSQVSSNPLPGGSVRPPCGHEIGVGPRRVAAKIPRVRHRDDAHVETRGAREARDDVTVAGVVAGTAEHGHAPRGGPVLAQRCERRDARALHQFVAGNAALLDREPVHGAHGCGRIDLDGQRIHARDYTGRLPRNPAHGKPFHRIRTLAPARAARRARARTRLRPGRRRRHRPRRGRGQPRSLARRGATRRHGLHGASRASQDPAGGARAGNAARHQRAHGSLSAGCRPGRRGAGRRQQGLRRTLRARTRLPQGHAQPARPARDPCSRTSSAHSAIAHSWTRHR